MINAVSCKTKSNNSKKLLSIYSSINSHNKTTNSTTTLSSLQSSMTTVLETCRIPPPPESAAELTIPLSFLDIIWLHYHPIRRVLFYEHPCSKTEFLQTLVPKLKLSLSLTLKHYLPAAGNLLYPSDTGTHPVLRYAPGDSITLVVAETSSDFDELVANHARDADQFYGLVPKIGHVTEEPGYKIVPVLALQVTLIPGRGICLGFANYHVLGDASSIVGFMSAWAEINKLGECGEIVRKEWEVLPIFDRSVMKDSVRIGAIFWKEMGKIPFKAESFPLPTGRVRATFVLTLEDIKRLKSVVLEKKPGVVQVSSFVVTTSYVWSCLVKSGNEEVGGDVLEYFVFPVDARGRVDPPVPTNYFGNCLGYGLATIEHEKIAGEEGFVNAAEAIGEEIKNRVHKKNELLKGAENWVSEMGKFVGIKAMGVSGSPKFDLPNVDFGWGKARKLEVVHIDGEKYSMSICKSRDFEGGLEIGMSLPLEMMEHFASTFAHGLRS